MRFYWFVLYNYITMHGAQNMFMSLNYFYCVLLPTDKVDESGLWVWKTFDLQEIPVMSSGAISFVICDHSL